VPTAQPSPFGKQQTPFVQMYSAQWFPQLPQFVQSVFVLVHWVPLPEGQIALSPAGQQFPCTHVWVVGQALPQLPQLSASVIGSLQPKGGGQNWVWPGWQQALCTGPPLMLWL